MKSIRESFVSDLGNERVNEKNDRKISREEFQPRPKVFSAGKSKMVSGLAAILDFNANKTSRTKLGKLFPFFFCGSCSLVFRVTKKLPEPDNVNYMMSYSADSRTISKKKIPIFIESLRNIVEMGKFAWLYNENLIILNLLLIIQKAYHLHVKHVS